MATRLTPHEQSMLAAGCCPLCGTRFDDDSAQADRCDHEAGWYRDFLDHLTAKRAETEA